MILNVPWPLLRQIILVVAVLLAVGSVTIIGIERLRRLRSELRPRLTAVYPYLLLIGLVFAVNSFVRNNAQWLSWLLDWKITGLIYNVEGNFVAHIQSFATEELTAFFSVIYIYGYVFLLVFPFFAYLAKDDLTSFRELIVAYSFNYTIGVVCYMLFIAYGPRNLLYPEVQSLMYIHWPRSQILTGEINSNVNVFPSLHTSISATVVLMAYRTRETYRSWLFLSTPIALCVIISTMYLGIHWATDVVAGLGLAVVSLWLASRVTDENGESQFLIRTADRVLAGLLYPVRVGKEWLAAGQSTDTESQS